MQMVTPLSSACAFTLFRSATQLSAPSASAIPLRLPLNVMMFGTALALASSIAACISGSSFSCSSLRLSPSAIPPPGPGGYIVGVNPYFLIVGQSAGPFKSYPTMPRDAASLQPSSRLVPPGHPPRVTHCFNRPFFIWGAGVCASAAEAAKAGRQSLRRMMHEYHSAGCSARVSQVGGLPPRYNPSMRPLLLCLLALSAAAQDATVLKPARVFDGETSHEAWAVRVRGDRIEAAGPAASIDTAKIRR